MERDNIVDEIESIIKLYGKIDVKFNDGNTPLLYAVEKGDIERVTILLEYNASVHCKDVLGDTPLHLAVSNNGDDIRLVKILLLNGANISAKNNRGLEPLHTAVLIRNIKITTELLDSGANISATTDCGSTPLHFATSGDYDMVELLLTRGADVNARDKDNSTPLHDAMRCNYKNIIRLLMQYGADSTIVDVHGNTPATCSENIKPETVEFLESCSPMLEIKEPDVSDYV